jgi:hypothetical protein
MAVSSKNGRTPSPLRNVKPPAPGSAREHVSQSGLVHHAADTHRSAHVNGSESQPIRQLGHLGLCSGTLGARRSGHPANTHSRARVGRSDGLTGVSSRRTMACGIGVAWSTATTNWSNTPWELLIQWVLSGDLKKQALNQARLQRREIRNEKWRCMHEALRGTRNQARLRNTPSRPQRSCASRTPACGDAKATGELHQPSGPIATAAALQAACAGPISQQRH